MDNYYLITGIFLLFNIIINTIIKIRLNHYSKFYVKSNLSGKEIAEKMLMDNGINDVNVHLVNGNLTDHYNPLNKTINLSKNVFFKKNAVSIAIATHECGHAMQHKLGGTLLKLRDNLVPILNFSSRITHLSIIYGLAIFYSSEGKYSIILKIGIILFSLIVIFSLITLPIEFDASKRALNWLKKKNLVNYKEYSQVKSSLNLAAMTYIIAALGDLTNLAYFISVFDDNKK